MRPWLRFVLAASQATFATLALGCAHAPAASEPLPVDAAAPSRPDALAAAPQVVTGSRIPQHVDVCAGLPATTANVRVYCRQRILETGRDPNLGAALRQLDPSVSTHP